MSWTHVMNEIFIISTSDFEVLLRIRKLQSISWIEVWLRIQYILFCNVVFHHNSKYVILWALLPLSSVETADFWRNFKRFITRHSSDYQIKLLPYIVSRKLFVSMYPTLQEFWIILYIRNNTYCYLNIFLDFVKGKWIFSLSAWL